MKLSKNVARLTGQASDVSQKVLSNRLGVRHESVRVGTPLGIPASGDYDQSTTRIKSKQSERRLQHIPTSSLLRGMILGQIFKTPFLYKPGLSLLQKIASSKSIFLDADRNPLIRALVLPLIYRQFCAGRDVNEVKQTIASIKDMGYTGVILCYSGEVMAQKDQMGQHSEVGQASSDDIARREIESWRDGHLATLEAISEGDYIGVKSVFLNVTYISYPHAD